MLVPKVFPSHSNRANDSSRGRVPSPNHAASIHPMEMERVFVHGTNTRSTGRIPAANHGRISSPNHGVSIRPTNVANTLSSTWSKCSSYGRIPFPTHCIWQAFVLWTNASTGKPGANTGPWTNNAYSTSGFVRCLPTSVFAFVRGVQPCRDDGDGFDALLYRLLWKDLRSGFALNQDGRIVVN